MWTLMRRVTRWRSQSPRPAETKARSTKIPKDIRLPVLMIVLNCFTNTATYVIEYSTFALFFREVHNWNEATLAGVAQTAGDVMAAIMMQVIPFHDARRL